MKNILWCTLFLALFFITLATRNCQNKICQYNSPHGEVYSLAALDKKPIVYHEGKYTFFLSLCHGFDDDSSYFVHGQKCEKESAVCISESGEMINGGNLNTSIWTDLPNRPGEGLQIIFGNGTLINGAPSKTLVELECYHPTNQSDNIEYIVTSFFKENSLFNIHILTPHACPQTYWNLIVEYGVSPIHLFLFIFLSCALCFCCITCCVACRKRKCPKNKHNQTELNYMQPPPEFDGYAQVLYYPVPTTEEVQIFNDEQLAKKLQQEELCS